MIRLRISGIWTTLEWFLLRCFGIDVKKSEMLQGRQDGPPPTLSNLSAKNQEAVLTLAKELYHLQEERAKLLFEKSKILLAISTIVVSVLVPFRNKWEPSWMILFPVFFVFVTIVLILISNSLKAMMEPSIDSELLNSTAATEAITRDYYISTFYNQRTVSLLADIFRAARRAFAVSLIALVLITVFSLWVRISAKQMNTVGLQAKSPTTKAIVTDSCK